MKRIVREIQERCLEGTCQRRFNPSIAKANNHEHYCSSKCASGATRVLKPKSRERDTNSSRERLFTEKERQQYRQERRVRRKANKETKTVAIDFYQSREWRELRFKILRKYGFSCMACGSKPPIKLHVDHIKPRSKHPELELTFENLQVLCEDCNLGKCNYSEEDLRPA